jgi:hypothetical protein
VLTDEYAAASIDRLEDRIGDLDHPAPIWAAI